MKIFMDHNATTPLHPEVRKVMSEAMDVFGNPSSLHEFGREARRRVEDARARVAAFIGAESEEIVFTGSGSEANNTVLSLVPCASMACACAAQGAHRVVTTAIEHPCVLEAAKCMENRGAKVFFLNVDRQGKVDRRQYEEVIGEGAVLVSVMMANNEIGTVQDIKRLAAFAHEHGALFHTDAVQAVGKIPVSVNDLGVDFLTLSAHKIYGPKGVGALYVRKGARYCPLVRGGHQEKGRRAGTENTLGIIGLGKAIEMREKEMKAEAKRLWALKKRMRAGIAKTVADVSFNGHPDDNLPGTLNVSFEGAEGEAILLYLDLEGIAVSTGSACASGSLDPSHVLLATGLDAERAHGSIRLSLGRDNTDKDADKVLEVLPGVIAKIRKMSTAYEGKKS